MKKSTAAIVLAAGKGSRINAHNKNKVLYQLADKPMISYTVDLLFKADVSPIIVVVGFQKQKVMNYLGEKFVYIKQGKLLGTGHAVKRAMKAIPKKTKNILVLYGDHSTFYSTLMINKLINHHQQTNAAMTFISVKKNNPKGYGRILRDKSGNVLGIREQKDATEKEKKITEINSGTYCFKADFLNKYLSKIKKNPVKGEYYLTDLVEIGLKGRHDIQAIKEKDEKVSLGINTREELAEADRQMRKKLRK